MSEGENDWIAEGDDSFEELDDWIAKWEVNFEGLNE